LRLLEHDFGHQDVIGVGGLAPGQVAAMASIPREETMPESPAVGRSRQRKPCRLGRLLCGHLV
jgi:hypothetical protein